MEDQVIVTTPAQLQSIIGEAVGAIIPKLADFRRKNEAVETDGMTVEEAARFLTEQGIPTTRASLYISSIRIPCLTANSVGAPSSPNANCWRGWRSV